MIYQTIVKQTKAMIKILLLLEHVLLPIINNWTTLKRFNRRWFPLNTNIFSSLSCLKDRLNGNDHISQEIYNKNGLIERDNVDITMSSNNN